ncbi:nitrogen regulation protein NR(II) [Aliikangiella sp. IMCC44359]|uniref:nitrogen regulation protein NR(II) n=1 Tax=Aliikangiella sp. IMCC44359 TaxID=3459125 RepID=UPI00403AFA94
MPVSLSINSLVTAIILLDNKHHIAYLNQSAEQLLGYSGKQIRDESFFELVKGDFDQALLDRFSQQQNTALLEEIEIKTSTGVLTTNIVLSNYQKENKQYTLLELQSNEHHSRIRKDIELQQQSRVSNHLIKNLAHEIKNPLGGIKGAAQLLERKLPSQFSNKYSQIIIRESDRLSQLVDRLLLPSKPEEKSFINTHILIEQALELVLLQQKHPIQIIKNYDPSLPNLRVSPGQIQQALLNLIKNAAEAISSDGAIEIRTRIIHQHTIGKIQHRQVIRIDILDNGSGIPSSLIKDIFFPTISGKNGTGLGLSIAQSLVQRHGGIIEVENLETSSLDQEKRSAKTCFSLYLPVEKENDSKHT